MTVDEYIAAAPQPARAQLEELRAAIREAAPDAEELISYGMPYYKRNGRLVYFSLHKDHIGLYPFMARDVAGTELAPFASSKSTIRLPLDQPLPRDAVIDAVRRRAAMLDAS